MKNIQFIQKKFKLNFRRIKIYRLMNGNIIFPFLSLHQTERERKREENSTEVADLNSSNSYLTSVVINNFF